MFGLANMWDYMPCIRRYGNGQSIQRAAAMKATIDGTDGSWSLPLPPLHPTEASSNTSDGAGTALSHHLPARPCKGFDTRTYQ